MMSHTTSEVFGINRNLPLNYGIRHNVDGKFISSLARDKHIVIYGSSKQGKTSLRKYNLQDDDYVVIHCTQNMGLTNINSAILKAAGFEIMQSSSKTENNTYKINATFKVPFLGSATPGIDKQKEISSVKKPLELDPEDVNDIILALKSIEFSKYIIIEDFHYLQTEIQKQFSFQLKAFHEGSKFCFIIIGVWVEENRLIMYNGDLVGRIVSINADLWSKEELYGIVDKGEELLNIKFDSAIKDEMVNRCFDNVYILQEICFRSCEEEGIFKTSDTQKIIGENLDIGKIVKSTVNEQSGRYNSFIEKVAHGFQQTELEMYRWILFPILSSSPEQLSRGITLRDITKELKKHHPRGISLNTGNITQALSSITSLQIKKQITPIILDYDSSDLTLKVVDRSFVIWLETIDRGDLMDRYELSSQ